MNPLDGVDVAAEYLSKSYQAGSGLIASAVAVYSSYMMIEVARRVRAAERELALGWLITGAMCVGTGVWASHFMGLLSMRLPVEVGYDMPLTVVSWFLAVISVGVVLSLLARPHLAMPWRVLGALTLATGICATHYLGILSLGMHTGIDWDLQVMALSGAIALAAMIMASSLIRRTLDGASPITLGRILLAALPCALGLRAVQYAALNAAHFPMDAQSLSMGQLSGQALSGLITVATGLLFAVTQMAIVLDKRLHQRQDQLAHTLQHAHHELEDSAHRDALTRLFNRRGFERHLSSLLSQAQPTGHDLVLMFINLDGFKLVNQSLGHGHGDALLKQAATRLSELIRREDVVAHVAADEFVMLFQGRIDQDTARSLAQRAAQALATPFTLGTHEITLSCSIGIALAQVQDSANELISRSELAMRNAKAAGGGAQCFYEEGMVTATAGQIDLQRDLRLAIERGELMLYYQPKRHAKSGQCSGVEALLRWKHGTRGMVSPGEFIPLAERFGLIGALGGWVIHEACRQVRAWQDVGIDLQVAVNLSVHQLRQPDLADRIRDTIAEHGIAPQWLIFEITESVAMENVKASLKVFEQLAAIGVQLSIDDFGTGYSSLSYLSKLPASQLKIDRSFVMELDSSSNAHAIVEAVVRLAHALKLKVVAEGVETESQHQTLLALGCDELQGFLFARPMPATDLAAWLPPQTPPVSRPDDAAQVMDSDSDFALLL